MVDEVRYQESLSKFWSSSFHKIMKSFYVYEYRDVFS